MNEPFQRFALFTVVMSAVASLMLISIQARANGDAKASPKLSESERPIGTWRFRKHQRPVKVVALGGSSTAYYRGNYTRFIEMACSKVEVKNLGETGLGIKDLKTRFDRQVAKNRYIHSRDHEIWIMARGGLNSIYNPERVNWFLSRLFRRAKNRGFKTLALSLTPWGHERDRTRWKGVAGLKSKRATQLTVDFLMGRLNPLEALGRYAKRAEWEAGELPDISVNLYETGMRTSDAAPRNAEIARAQLSETRWVRKKLKQLTPTERTSYLDQLATELADVPRWHLRKDLRAFDAIHPNTHGHREIAKLTCPKLPQNWGCNCDALDRIVWGKKGLEMKPVQTATR